MRCADISATVGFVELHKRVISIADSLGLGNWTIRVVERPEELHSADEEDDESHTYAETFPGPGEARIYFFKPFYDALPHEQVQAILHELLHCVFYPVDEVINNLPGLADGLASLMQKVNPGDGAACTAVLDFFFGEIKRNYDERAELMVDALAMTIKRIAEGSLKG